MQPILEMHPVKSSFFANFNLLIKWGWDLLGSLQGKPIWKMHSAHIKKMHGQIRRINLFTSLKGWKILKTYPSWFIFILYFQTYPEKVRMSHPNVTTMSTRPKLLRDVPKSSRKNGQTRPKNLCWTLAQKPAHNWQKRARINVIVWGFLPSRQQSFPASSVNTWLTPPKFATIPS